MPTGLEALIDSLPPSCEAGSGEDWDRRSRATLSYLLDRIPIFGPADFQVVPANPANCPNCDSPAVSDRSPYCGTVCREESAFVRQFRNGLAEGSILNEERQAALGQKLWHVLGGGYPRRVALIPPKALARYLAKNATCTYCEAPAVTVDNVGSG